ncbi:hypothetical protein C8A00DRAFT_17884 [Chaetomidium leptoderma]|uniref:Hydrophobin n=1 Tax=Chaetomidium leptoderma TaxID=669021 RepID=A0AAN6VFN8_9PEZI|nr:hypothetical protein C8A00DRAFT_17884 [Chaetomidium leptoderma]
MQLSAVFTILAVAMTASALPSEGGHGSSEGGHGGAPGGDVEATLASCNSDSKNVCCNKGNLNCVVAALGKNCEGSSYCCKTGETEGVLVNLDLLSCSKLG